MCVMSCICMLTVLYMCDSGIQTGLSGLVYVCYALYMYVSGLVYVCYVLYMYVNGLVYV